MIAPSAETTRSLRLTAAAAVAASAMLMFALEPFAGKALLPRLGGAPSIWNTCVMVFQLLLLAGYGYSVMLSRMRLTRHAILVHAGLAIAAAAAWPFTLRLLWMTPPDGWPPVPWIVLAVLGSIGPPFVLLSATSPLLQVWTARAVEDASGVHRLYAVSNLASMVGLAAYVVAIEPFVGLRRQGLALGAAFAGTMAITLWAAGLAARRRAALEAEAKTTSEVVFGRAALEHEPKTTSEVVLAPGTRRGWIARSCAASMCLYSVNTYIATDVASVPLLWCLPLGLFLLAFAAGFTARAARWRSWIATAALLAVGVAIGHLAFLDDARTVRAGLIVPLVALALAVTALSVELAIRRPEPDRLPGFYTAIGAGGVVAGGLSVLTVPWLWSMWSAPDLPILARLLAFRGAATPVFFGIAVTEYPVTLLVAAWMLSGAAGRGAKAVLHAVLAISIAVTIGVLANRLAPPSTTAFDYRWAAIGLAVAAAIALTTRAGRLASACVVLAVVGPIMQTPSNPTRFEARNFFGTSRVQLAGDQYRLLHGTTLHGLQPAGLDRDRPTSYYGYSSPLGHVMSTLGPRTVLVLGLGTGTIAAYARAGDSYEFLELNPLVMDIATDPRWFSYVKDARDRGARVAISIGDGRLLAARFPERSFDLIVVDAFSSDAIPVHLLSVEAIAVFKRILSDRGVIAYHISNRFFDLRPVVASGAAATGLVWASQDGENMGANEYATTWVMVSRDAEHAAAAGVLEMIPDPPDFTPARRPWTDDWANVLGTLKWTW